MTKGIKFMIDKIKKYSYILIAVVFVLICGLWFFQPTPVLPPREDSPTVSGSIIRDSIIGEDNNGRKSWEVTVETMEMDIATQNNKLKGIKGTFYLEDGRNVDLVADSGTISMTTKDMLLKGNIVVSMSDDGSTLISNELKWSNKDSILTAIGEVNLTKVEDGGNLVANELSWNKKTDIFVANGEVIITIPKDEIIAKADMAETDRKFENLKLSGKANILKGVKPQ